MSPSLLIILITLVSSSAALPSQMDNSDSSRIFKLIAIAGEEIGVFFHNCVDDLSRQSESLRESVSQSATDAYDYVYDKLLRFSSACIDLFDAYSRIAAVALIFSVSALLAVVLIVTEVVQKCSSSSPKQSLHESTCFSTLPPPFRLNHAVVDETLSTFVPTVKCHQDRVFEGNFYSSRSKMNYKRENFPRIQI